MDLHPENRDLSALDRVRRMHLHRTWKFALTWIVTCALGVWCGSWPDNAKPDDFTVVRAICSPLLGFAGLAIFLLFIATVLSHGSAVRKIKETRAVRAAMAAHHDLPPRVIAHMAAKAWHWRALCISGGVMAVSLSGIVAVGYFHPGGNESVQAIGIAILFIAFLWSIPRFVLAALRFIRFTRLQSSLPPPGSGT
jgi:p-aminobenzoyl-glutamate transporter AbgT